MEEIGKKGITILFVSHDTQTINKFCSQAIWLHGGIVKEKGIPQTILENYMSFMSYGIETERSVESNREINHSESSLKKDLINVQKSDSFGEKQALINKIGFFDEDDILTSNLKQGTMVKFICEFSTTVDLYDVAIGVLFKDSLNNDIITFNSYMYNSPLKYVEKGKTICSTIVFKVPKIYPKEYLITVALSEGTQLNHVQQHWIHSATTVNIISCDFTDACILSLYPNEIEYKYE